MDDDGDDGDDAASLELITSSPVSHGLLSDSFFFFAMTIHRVPPV